MNNRRVLRCKCCSLRSSGKPFRLALQLFVSETRWAIGIDTESFVSERFVGCKVAFAPMHVAIAFKGQDMRSQAIEEPTIVRDDDYAACVVLNTFFQCSKRIDVQIVGRFVKQQDVGTSTQELGQMDTVAFTT